MKILVTGSSGLIGSEVVRQLSPRVNEVLGIDNDQRRIFFGEAGSTRSTQKSLEENVKNFVHHEVDIRDRVAVQNLIAYFKPDVIVHTAAQPSHDKAASIVFDDFETNAVGTLNLLEATRQFAADCIFIHMSTNKVYGDAPNNLALKETDTRFDFTEEAYSHGIDETFTVDQSKHSLFGASKLSADILVQEYGRYFGLRSCCIRGGCLTGPNHSGVELHGFLSYLVKTNMLKEKYTVFGHKAKQVRDNIHSKDVASFIWEFINAPRTAEVYNLGGGKLNSVSMLEAFSLIEDVSRKKMNWEYADKAREGDHIVYYSDLRKIKSHFPNWQITMGITDVFVDLHENWRKRLAL